MLVQPRRDKVAALRLMRKLLRKQGYAPTVLVTDLLPPILQADDVVAVASLPQFPSEPCGRSRSASEAPTAAFRAPFANWPNPSTFANSAGLSE